VHPHPGNRQQLGTLLGILDRVGSGKALKGSSAVFQSGERHFVRPESVKATDRAIGSVDLSNP
jgi:hypothetical protein